ncbi:MAG: hypothetical protein ACE5I1_21020, partial [bacterium]
FQVHDIRSHYISAEKNGVINCFGLNISLKNKRKIVRSIIDDSNNNEFLYQDRVYGCEELPGAGGYNELIGGFRYLFEIEKRKQEASFQKTEETYSFLFSRVPGKVSALEGERVNQYLSWHKFPNEKELKRWQGRHNLICNPINKRSGEAKKDISVYKKGV